jgi:hypothetical protein
MADKNLGQSPEEDLEETKPLKTASGSTEQIDVFSNRVIIREKGLSNSLKVRAEFKPSQITSIIIKPAGTLYDGNMELTAFGIKYYVKFKAYTQPDFEQIKVLLSK